MAASRDLQLAADHMPSETAIKLLTLPVIVLLAISALRSALGRSLPRKWRVWLVYSSVTVFVFRWLVLYVVNADSSTALDHAQFWKYGRAFVAGEDIYTPEGQARLYPHFAVYPPTMPPLMSPLAILSENWSFRVVQALAVVLFVAIGPLAWQAIRHRLDTPAPASSHLDALDVMTLGLLVGFSPALHGILRSGNIVLLFNSCLLGALWARSAGRPISAGLLLAIAAIKPTLTAPFLILFLHRRDRLTWVAFGCVTLLLIELAGGVLKLPAQIDILSRNAEAQWAPGGENDYTFGNTTENAANENRLGFDHFFFRLGVHDPAQIRVINTAAVSIVVVLTSLFVLWRRTAWPASCSLVAIASLLFFYHRTYDGGILMLPILYAADRLRTGAGKSRLWYGITVLSCFALLYTPGQPMKQIIFWSLKHEGWESRLLHATVISWPMWSVLIAYSALVRAELTSGTTTIKGKS